MLFVGNIGIGSSQDNLSDRLKRDSVMPLI